MMYRHQIDEQIRKLTNERRTMQKFGNYDQAFYIQQKIDSWYRVRDDAPVAKFGREEQ